MEPWAAKFVKGLSSEKVVLVDASRGVTLRKAVSESEHGHEAQDLHDHYAGMDPHIWLDFSNARIIVDTITYALISKDPQHKSYFTAHADALKIELTKLDETYKSGLSSCKQRVFLHGGHYTFGYLAARYGLQYKSASAVNSDAEPSPATLIELIRQVKALKLKNVFSEELLSPRVSEMIAREAGVSILMLHGAHNISRDDMQQGTSFISLMNKNLVNLKIGLECM
jgi:zinc transport system substrate-binding protein